MSMKKALRVLLLAGMVFITTAGVAAAGEPYAFYVYDDYMADINHYGDIAYMGSHSNGADGSMTIKPNCTEDPYSGDTCLEISYNPKGTSHWAGMLWLSGNGNFPPNEPVEGVDTARARNLVFWARGAGATKFFIENDTGRQVSKYVRMSGQWTQYALEVPADWENVCVGFGWASNYNDSDGKPMTFYLDEILFTE